MNKASMFSLYFIINKNVLVDRYQYQPPPPLFLFPLKLFTHCFDESAFLWFSIPRRSSLPEGRRSRGAMKVQSRVPKPGPFGPGA